MIFAYLLLAHLLGDFVFQPTELVLWKMKKKSGTLVHCQIHFLINIMILMPIILKGYLWPIWAALLLSLVHFAIDESKIKYEKKHNRVVYSFLIDQIFHLLAMFAVFMVVKDRVLDLPRNFFYIIYSDTRLSIFISMTIFISTIIEIYQFQKIREKNPHAIIKLNWTRMLARMLIFTVIYLGYIILDFYAWGV